MPREPEGQLRGGEGSDDTSPRPGVCRATPPMEKSSLAKLRLTVRAPTVIVAREKAILASIAPPVVKVERVILAPGSRCPNLSSDNPGGRSRSGHLLRRSTCISGPRPGPESRY